MLSPAFLSLLLVYRKPGVLGIVAVVWAVVAVAVAVRVVGAAVSVAADAAGSLAGVTGSVASVALVAAIVCAWSGHGWHCGVCGSHCSYNRGGCRCGTGVPPHVCCRCG